MKGLDPEGTLRRNDVVLTSMRRHVLACPCNETPFRFGLNHITQRYFLNFLFLISSSDSPQNHFRAEKWDNFELF